MPTSEYLQWQRLRHEEEGVADRCTSRTRSARRGRCTASRLRGIDSARPSQVTAKVKPRNVKSRAARLELRRLAFAPQRKPFAGELCQGKRLRMSSWPPLDGEQRDACPTENGNQPLSSLFLFGSWLLVHTTLQHEGKLSMALPRTLPPFWT